MCHCRAVSFKNCIQDKRLFMDISITPISINEKEILRNLLEKYEYDNSQYESTDVNDCGLYGYKYLDHYWTDKNRYAYFIKANNKLAGFIMIDDYLYYNEIKSNYCISEFFVMKKYRRMGVGKYAVKYIVNKYRGKWQIGYNPNNNTGKIFWNTVVKEITNEKYEIINDNKTHSYGNGIYSEVLIFET